MNQLSSCHRADSKIGIRLDDNCTNYVAITSKPIIDIAIDTITYFQYSENCYSGSIDYLSETD